MNIVNIYIYVKMVEPCLRLSRWAMRMNADIGFPVSSGGRVGVPSPGLYLVYAQVASSSYYLCTAFSILKFHNQQLLIHLVAGDLPGRTQVPRLLGAGE